jgi:hypothetical protein
MAWSTFERRVHVGSVAVSRSAMVVGPKTSDVTNDQGPERRCEQGAQRLHYPLDIMLTTLLFRRPLLQEDCSFLADHYAGRHRIAGRDTRQNGRIGNPKSLYAIHSEIAIDNGHRVMTHLRSTALVPESAKPVAKEVLKVCYVERTRRDLVARKWPERSGIADLTRSSQPIKEVFHVLRISEVICVDSNGIAWTRARQPDFARARRTHAEH